MHAPTRRQREVLDFLSRYIDSHGYRPSYQVIARHFGVSSRAGIGRIIRDIEDQGFLERRRTVGHFAIAVLNKNGEPSNGVLIDWLDITGADAVDGNGAPFHLPDFMLAGIDPFDMRAFRVADDAMAESAICRGDVALIEQNAHPRDGDIVAARVKRRDVLLRSYRRTGADVELCDAGADGKCLRLSAEKIEVLGVFRGLLRPVRR
jgi:repressor LexA